MDFQGWAAGTGDVSTNSYQQRWLVNKYSAKWCIKRQFLTFAVTRFNENAWIVNATPGVVSQT